MAEYRKGRENHRIGSKNLVLTLVTNSRVARLAKFARNRLVRAQDGPTHGRMSNNKRMVYGRGPVFYLHLHSLEKRLNYQSIRAREGYSSV